MLVDETITHLEMTAPDQLVPGRLPPTPIDLERHDRASLPLLRSTYARIGAPHGWVTRPAWSDAQWQEWLSTPGVQPWLARVGGEVAGLVELELQPDAEVGIVVIGLVPEFVGRGFGGHLLTLGTRLAWEANHPDGASTREPLPRAGEDPARSGFGSRRSRAYGRSAAPTGLRPGRALGRGAKDFETGGEEARP